MIDDLGVLTILRRLAARFDRFLVVQRAKDDLALHERCRHVAVGACEQCRADDWADRTV